MRSSTVRRLYERVDNALGKCCVRSFSFGLVHSASKTSPQEISGGLLIRHVGEDPPRDGIVLPLFHLRASNASRYRTGL